MNIKEQCETKSIITFYIILFLYLEMNVKEQREAKAITYLVRDRIGAFVSTLEVFSVS